jgi:simple sugar transport system permease protein
MRASKLSYVRIDLTKFTQWTFALLIGLSVGALFILIFGYDPLEGYLLLFKGAFGSVDRLFETIAFATPLMLTGSAFIIGARGNVFNIGLEGQVYFGAIGAVIVGGKIALPPLIHVTVALAFAMFLGALWAMLVALLKIWKGINEIISGIMLNWIAYYFVMYFSIYYLIDPETAYKTIPVLPSARFPRLIEGSTLTATMFVSVLFCILVYLLLWRTSIGYEIRLTGTNPEASRYAGISFRRVVILAFIVSGLGGGLAGATQILGRPPTWYLLTSLGNVYMLGFDGIAVALMGRNHPIAGMLAAIFYGGLLNGGRLMEAQLGIASELVRSLTALIVIFLAIPEILATIRRFK